MEKPHSTASPIIAAILLLLPVLYVVSYLALVRRDRSGPVTVAPNGWYVIGSKYAAGGSYAEILFWPLEQLDRRLQPEAWEELERMGVDFK